MENTARTKLAAKFFFEQLFSLMLLRKDEESIYVEVPTASSNLILKLSADDSNAVGGIR